MGTVKQEPALKIGPPASAWQMLETEQSQLEVALSELRSISEDSKFHHMVDLCLQRLSTITDIEERLVEKFAAEADLDESGKLRARVSGIAETAKVKPGSAVSSHEAA